MRCWGLLVLACVLGCKGGEVVPPAPEKTIAEKRAMMGRGGGAPLTLAVDLGATLQFKTKLAGPTVTKPGWQIWDCSYTNRGSTENFRLETKFGQNRGLRLGTGTLLNLEKKPCPNLLRDLKPILRATKTPVVTKRMPSLTFELAVFGERQTRQNDGSFANEPPGGWTSLKLFVGPKKSELFVNLNATTGQAEFGMKDTSQGNDLLSEFASVLG